MIRKRVVHSEGFSLFEMLAVLVIISIILAWTVPSMIPALAARSITAAGDEFEQSFNNARQIALVEDVVVDVEIISFQSGSHDSEEFAAYRFWKWLPAGNRVPLGKIKWLEGRLVFPIGLSTILRDGGYEQESVDLSQFVEGTTEAVRFSIYPNGETNLPARSDSDNWHITISTPTDSSTLPNNFICFEVNQNNSHITKYRP